jgi:hypothetical protein
VAGLRGRVLVTGSVYLVGALRARLLGEETDPLELSDPVAPPP